jgi:hypothetical protein
MGKKNDFFLDFFFEIFLFKRGAYKAYDGLYRL